MAQTLCLQNDTVSVTIQIGDDGAATLQHILPTGTEPKPLLSYFPDASLPLIELRLSGEANAWFKSAQSMVGSYIGSRLRYKSHKESEDDKRKTLDVTLHDETTGVTATSHMTVIEGLPFVRSNVTVKNDSSKEVVVNQMPSIIVGGLTHTKEWWHDYEASYANNTWFRETQWVTRDLPSLGLDNMGLWPIVEGQYASLASFTLSNRTSFSTQRHLPMGILRRKDQSETWMWQIESNGAWKWELGEYKDSIYLAASGPMADDHDWRQKLAPGEECNSLTVSVGHVFSHSDEAFAQLTDYRRAIRRPHVDHQKLPIIFNDYMNCLMGDPTEDKILALVDPVAKSGAEYFVIDAGWYADDSNWWDDVGEWEPSKKRFPSGFKALLDKIRAAGLKPGVWIEPEVVGVRNVMAERLPRGAFFERDGQRIAEKGRFQLDFRNNAVVEHMNRVFDKYVQEYGVAYFKFDYNIEVTQGTDIDCSSAGAGQLEHNRAYLAWVSSLLDRYPELVIENCSSGAQRMDYAMLAVHTLQSTSDQQSPELYAAISATVHTAVTPEQGATWAYPQADWSDEINALTVVNSLLGRIHLSGRLDIMSQKQLEIVYDGMKVYQDIRKDIPNSLPFWPLGIAGWHDDWLALGLKARNSDGTETGVCYLAVWRRGGPTTCALPITQFKGRTGVKVEYLYPKRMEAKSSWDDAQSAVRVEVPETICARLFKLEL